MTKAKLPSELRAALFSALRNHLDDLELSQSGEPERRAEHLERELAELRREIARRSGVACRSISIRAEMFSVLEKHLNELQRAASNVAHTVEDHRLRKLFADAGQGEHNVLALIDHYQRNSMEADERLRAVRAVLEAHGCDCDCDHHHEEHGPDCERCLACRIADAIGEVDAR